jgi:hypothetical protein
MPSGKSKPYMKPTFNAGRGDESQGFFMNMQSAKERDKLVFNRKKKKKNK